MPDVSQVSVRPEPAPPPASHLPSTSPLSSASPLPPASPLPRAPHLSSAPEEARFGAAAAPAGRTYLDNQASTPMDPAALAVMQQVAEQTYANPTSAHRSGKRAAEIIETARERLAETVGALPEEIVFTSGATESNNLALLGVARAAVQRGDDRRVVVTLPIEHPSVLAPARFLRSGGFELRLAPVHRDGRVDLDALAEMLEPSGDGGRVLLLSLQTANNEIGTIQPVVEAAALAREHGVLIHSDAAQALGKTPFEVEALDLDFASLSGHKCYGPKGVGALFVRGGARRAPIAPLFHGGGHERGLRPGTPNTPGIAAFSEAATRAVARLPEDAPRLAALRDRLEREIAERVPGVRINGCRDHRLPNATSITFPGADADALIANLPDYDLSAASACHSGTPEPSPVLRALGLSPEDAYSTLRLAVSPTTERTNTDRFVDAMCAALASCSPPTSAAVSS